MHLLCCGVVAMFFLQKLSWLVLIFPWSLLHFWGSLSLWTAYCALLAQAGNLRVSLTSSSLTSTLRILCQVLMASTLKILLNHPQLCASTTSTLVETAIISHLMTTVTCLSHYNKGSLFERQIFYSLPLPFAFLFFPLGGTKQGKHPSLSPKKLSKKRQPGCNTR